MTDSPAKQEPQAGGSPIFVVTGGGGFIGSHLVDLLRRERPDATVRVLDNFVTGQRSNLAHYAKDPQVEITQGTISHRPTLDKVFAGAERVFHLAALASVPRSLQHPLETDLTNSHGTLLVLDAAKKAGVNRVVYAGSSSAYGNNPAESKSESLPVDPLSPYAASKLSGEHYARAYANCWGLETVVVRYFNVFGPRQSARSQYAAVIPIFISKMLRGQKPPVFGDGKQSRDFTFVANVVRGTLLASEASAEKVSGRVFNVACGDSISLLDLIARLNDILGTSLEPDFRDPRPGDAKHSRADISAAREAFDYKPEVSFAEGLRQTVEAHRAIVEEEEREANVSTPIKA
jgi:nucleoside-diphosphate-sugar epimerase